LTDIFTRRRKRALRWKYRIKYGFSGFFMAAGTRAGRTKNKKHRYQYFQTPVDNYFKNMFYSLTDIVVIIFKAFELLILIRILMSWVPFGRNSEFRNFVRAFTEPLLRPFRISVNLNPAMGVDLSPMIAIFVLYQVEMLVLHLIRLV